MSLKDDILAQDDLPSEVVDVPEWGHKLIVRGLTSEERDAYTEDVTNLNTGTLKWKNASALLVVRTVVDDGGYRVFSDKDAPALGKKSAQAVNRLFTVAMRLSGLTDEDVEQLVEDFGEAQSGSSATA